MPARDVDNLMFLETARDVFSLTEEPGRMPECFPAALLAVIPEVRMAASQLRHAESFCASPIEVQLLRAMFSCWYDRASGYALIVRGKGETAIASSAPTHVPRLVVNIQDRIEKYTADFTLCIDHKGRQSRVVVVECDGQDFHSSPEQVAHDKTRDRHMASLGHVVMRFTGSQIFNGVAGCVKELTKLLLKLNKEVR